MHKLISPFVGLLFVLTMSSCSGETTADEDASTTSDATTSAAPVENDTPSPSPDEEFVEKLHEAIPGTDQGNKADYIRLAKLFCGYLDDGYTPQGVVMSWASEGGKAESASTLLKIAVPIYCPQHNKVVERNLS